MLSADEARMIILQSVRSLGTETAALLEAFERILGEDITAPHDVPLFDNSSMDGYAVRSADIAAAESGRSVPLKVQGEVSAGSVFEPSLMTSHAIRIMTGAPIPAGADTVVEQESTQARNGTVDILAAAPPGRNIRRRGEDIRAGSVVLKKGVRLHPARVGILASLGITKMSVFRKPRVAILTTGSEVVDIDRVPGPGQVRNSNAVTLEGMVRSLGADLLKLGFAKDDEKELRRSILSGLENDVLITSGGVSVGKHDLVLETLRTLKVDIKFWKVNIKPGMPMAFGIGNPTGGRTVPVFALPGNPVSTMVTFLQFVKPGLEKMAGLNDESKPIRVRAVLKEDLKKSDKKRHFLRAIARNENGSLVVQTTGSQSSGVLTSLAHANCLIVLPEDKRDPKAGEEVEIEFI